jgi:hypothetical protein
LAFLDTDRAALSYAEVRWFQSAAHFADVKSMFESSLLGLADGLYHHMLELEYLLTVFVRYFGAVFFEHIRPTGEGKQAGWGKP